MGNYELLYGISLHCQGKGNRGISVVVQKCIKFYCLLNGAVARCPCFFSLAVPKKFRYQVWGHEPGTVMHRHRGMLTQKRLFSLAYGYKVGTSDKALKLDIILPALLLEYLQSMLFISIYQTQLEL
jgi:hypothetical protein